LTASTATTLNSLYVYTGGSFTGDLVLNSGGNITIDSSATFGGSSITLLGDGTIYEALAAGATGGNAGLSEAISIASGATLTLASDPGIAFAVGGAISGDGAVQINGGSVELTGVNTYTGDTLVQNASLTLDGQGAVPGGAITLTDAMLTTQPDSTGAVNFTDTIVGFGASDTIDAIAGNLLVYAGAAGLFTFIGGAGMDSVIGDLGAMNVTGGSAGDIVFGGAGTLTFTGGTGSSTVVGTTGAVTATGGSGGDLIFGSSSGHDVLRTGAGPSSLVGGNGAQLFATGSSNSLLVDGATPGGGIDTTGGVLMNAGASSGNDTLFGGAAGTTDTMISGTGTNIIVQLGGNTELFTTGTADVFAGTGILTLAYLGGQSGGVTNVEGFNVSQDVISLSGYASGTAAQVLASETVGGGNTQLQIPNGDKITLFGVTNLTIGNFT